MTTLIATTAVRQISLGNYVDNQLHATLPQTATATMFNVSGGVLLTSFAGRVTTVLGATVTTLSVGVTPSGGGAAQNAGLASATAVTSAAVNTILTLPATVGGALVVAAAAGTPVLAGFAGASALYVPAGAITITTSASDTGAIRWSLTYVPWDTGAAVTAA